jgi:hypothetical protein
LLGIAFATLCLALFWISCGSKEQGAQKAAEEGHAGHEMPGEQVPQRQHEQKAPAQTPTAPKEQKTTYHCPMHPEYTSDKPGNSPICGMNLVPVKTEEPKATPHSVGTLHIPEETLRAVGVTFGVAERRRLHKQIRAVARITYDETRLKEISTKFSGWVESLYADFTGKVVRAGEPLFFHL